MLSIDILIFGKKYYRVHYYKLQSLYKREGSRFKQVSKMLEMKKAKRPFQMPNAPLSRKKIR